MIALIDSWFLKYISKCQDEPMFYASYGSFIHKIIELYYKGVITKDQMLTKFLTEFSSEVKGDRPSANIVQSYIKSGIDYFTGFSPFEYDPVAVEKKISFDINGYNFVGYIDFLGLKNGEYYIVDNKSRNLKQRSKRKNPTLKDQELDDMLKQLYLYSAGVYQEFGTYPKALCFNCFKNKTFIKEQFDINAYHKALDWAKESIEKIKTAEEFAPKCDYFYCKYLCGVNSSCCYYDE